MSDNGIKSLTTLEKASIRRTNKARLYNSGKPDLVPAIPIAVSVRKNYIVCLEDGAKVQYLTPYLKLHYNMTPEQYREKYGLPRKYPMLPSFNGDIEQKKRARGFRTAGREISKLSADAKSVRMLFLAIDGYAAANGLTITEIYGRLALHSGFSFTKIMRNRNLLQIPVVHRKVMRNAISKAEIIIDPAVLYNCLSREAVIKLQLTTRGETAVRALYREIESLAFETGFSMKAIHTMLAREIGVCLGTILRYKARSKISKGRLKAFEHAIQKLDIKVSAESLNKVFY